MNASIQTQGLLMRICALVQEEQDEIEEIRQDKIAAMVPGHPPPEFACLLLDNLISEGFVRGEKNLTSGGAYYIHVFP